MPRVAVTALAYVGMGNTMNSLSEKLPAANTLCWLQVLVGQHLLICMVGSVCHLVIFNLNGNKEAGLTLSLNTTMRYYIPIYFVLSFVVATIFVYSSIAGATLVMCSALAPFLILGGNMLGEKAPPVPPTHASPRAPTIGLVSHEDAQSVCAPQRHSELDKWFSDLFRRYDLDESGMIDSTEELTQLAMACIYKMDLDSGAGMQPADVDFKVKQAYENAGNRGVFFTEEAAKDWFVDEFLASSTS
jgi:hypothetical protein